jgi:CubicO group peptidase (beta-lactamase class C family)
MRLTCLLLLVGSSALAEVTVAAELECQNKLFAHWMTEERPMLGIGGQVGDNSLDMTVMSLMAKFRLPGAQLAVAHNGKLVFAKSYGFSNSRDATNDSLFPLGPASQIVHLDDLFRLASVSKPFTAVEVIKLLKPKKDDTHDPLDQPVFPLLEADHIKAYNGQALTDEQKKVTIRMLLNFTTGFTKASSPWGAKSSDDPTDYARDIATAMKIGTPPSCHANIEYMLAKSKLETPGKQSEYNNFPYCVASAVVEHFSTSKDYEQAVKKDLLAPLGITRAQVGHSLERVAGEVNQIAHIGTEYVRSVFDHGPTMVFPQWGGWSVEATAGSGGWINTAIDEVRFLTAIDGSGPQQLLTDYERSEMTRVTDAACFNWSGKGYCDKGYGLGWNYITHDGDWWKIGGDPGMTNELRHLHQGYDYAIFFNGDSDYKDPKTGKAPSYDSEIVEALDAAILKAKFVDADWFDQYNVEFSDWKGRDGFKKDVEEARKHNHYAARIEGGLEKGKEVYRARFARLPAKYEPFSEIHMTCTEFNLADNVQKARTYKLIELQSYLDEQKIMRFQGTWMKY